MQLPASGAPRPRRGRKRPSGGADQPVPKRPEGTFLTDGRGVLYCVCFGLLRYFGWTTWVWDHPKDAEGREGRKQQVMDPLHAMCPLFVKFMHRMARLHGGRVSADPVFVLTEEGNRRTGLKRELLATVHGMRQADPSGGNNAHRVRGACFVVGVVADPGSFPPAVYAAYRDCVASLPVDADGTASGPLPDSLDSTLEALALRHPAVVGDHFDGRKGSGP